MTADRRINKTNRYYLETENRVGSQPTIYVADCDETVAWCERRVAGAAGTFRETFHRITRAEAIEHGIEAPWYSGWNHVPRSSGLYNVTFEATGFGSKSALLRRCADETYEMVRHEARRRATRPSASVTDDWVLEQLDLQKATAQEEVAL